jgi:alpha-ketoglutarate-dependent 2,4-dichlorophenoxyacetate dioxygenase
MLAILRHRRRRVKDSITFRLDRGPTGALGLTSPAAAILGSGRGGSDMSLTVRKLHPHFVGAVGPIDLRAVRDPKTLAEIRAGMDEYAVLVFHDQPFTDGEQLAFAQRLDGELHTKTGSSALYNNRLGNEALADISNVDENGEIMASQDRRREYSLGNRLWHTDASLRDPAGRYSMLSVRVVPPVAADTEFADMRGAYDALPAETKTRLEGLSVHHSIAHSRQILGFVT